MKISLKTLSLRNFKGIEKLEINFSDRTSIYGANESGKSTIVSAFTWLLTGKDEFDRKDYEIKNTLKTNLNQYPHEVEGVFEDTAGMVSKLKRVYMEKWTKPRGQATPLFDGHYSQYFFNDIELSATEYQAKVDGFLPAVLIKLLTNPTYFNTLKWQDQRRGLISIAGEISNEEVIKQISSPGNDYADLIAALNNPQYASLDEYRKHIQTKKKKLKEAADQFQPRINEAKHNMPESKDWETIVADIQSKKDRINSLDEQLSSSTTALKAKQAEINSLQKKVFDLEQKHQAIRQRIKVELQEKSGNSEAEISTLTNKVKGTKAEIERLQKEAETKNNNIKGYKLEIERLNVIIKNHRDKWEELNSEVFVFDESRLCCSFCKQPLPATDIEAERDRLKKNFIKYIADGKAEQVKHADARKEEVRQQEEYITAAKEAIFLLESQIDDLIAQQSTEEEQLAAVIKASRENKIPDIEVATDALLEKNGDALNLLDEINVLKSEISEKESRLNQESNTGDIKAERQALLNEVEDLVQQLGIKTIIEQAEKRIEQLQNEEQINAQEIAKLERQEFEIETFIRAQMDILEERVNKLFKYVSFQLFEKQVNGAIVETCVCKYKDVPYPTLNTAAKILAGLDVIETFSRHHDLYAPVFCDNRESVSFIPDITSQVISLYVSPIDKTLRIENN